MMPVEWPIAAPAAASPAAPARVAGRDRVPIVRQDLFLDDDARLTDQERALMSAMLAALVDQVADEIRLSLPPDLLAHVERDRDQMPARLWRSGALDQPQLVTLLLRRADEQSIAAAVRDDRRNRDGSIVERLVGDADAGVASAAMALAVARGRRRDRFGRLGLEFDDVSAAEAPALVHAVAAALRQSIADPSVAVDEVIAEAAERLLDRHGSDRRVERNADALAAALGATEGATDDLIAAMALEGDASTLAALCARRAGITSDTAWRLLVAGGAGDAMLLARLAQLQRPTAAAIVAAFAEPLSWGDAGVAIDWFDRFDPARIDAARRWWRLPPAYRTATRPKEGGDGHAID